MKIYTEEGLTKFLNSLCCNTCIFFLNKKCTEVNYEEHEREKAELAKAFEESHYKGWEATPEPVSEARREMLDSHLDWSKDIDNHYLCMEYKGK